MDDAGFELLVARHEPGRGLAGAFYAESDVYARELASIWRRSWVFAGHGGELRRVGDHVALEIGDDPIVVVRQHDGSVRAFYNVCRHRGSLLATDGCGHGQLLVCPYHGWSYGLDGTLRAAPGADGEVDRSQLSLREVAAAEVGGLIFVSLAASPTELAPFGGAVADEPEAAALSGAKVAARIEYDIAANWKLVWENNRECLHCALNHPQYVKANYDHPRPGDEVPGGLFEFPDEAGTQWWSVNRSPMRPPFVTESLNGEPVAPRFVPDATTSPETLRLRMLPSFWAHVSIDHAVTTRLSPTGPASTRAVVSWLVRGDAEEDRDYELSRLTPFWRLTSEQDWTICERNQRGVRSAGYVPGPLSVELERNVVHFHAWYLSQLRRVPAAT